MTSRLATTHTTTTAPNEGVASMRPMDAAAAAAGMDGPSKTPSRERPPTPAWTPANGRRRPQAAWETGHTDGRFPTAPTGQGQSQKSGTTPASLTR